MPVASRSWWSGRRRRGWTKRSSGFGATSWGRRSRRIVVPEGQHRRERDGTEMRAMTEKPKRGAPERTVTLREERQGRDSRNLWAFLDGGQGCLHIEGRISAPRPPL